MSSLDSRRKFIDPGCPIRSACKAESDKKFFGRLFETDWEVFVIKKNERTGKFGWTVLCCNAAPVNLENESKYIAAACC